VSDDTLTVDQRDNDEPAGATPPAAGAQSTIEDGHLARVTAERDEYLETLQRVQAEFENYRKRVLREQEAERARAVAGAIDTLLPVFDAFDGARSHHPDLLEPVDGVLHPALVALGVERIEPLGEPFDPEAHEAVAINVDDERAHGGDTVIEVLRAGYRCRGRLLRPAMVRVGEEPPAKE
jgi:molecular chaperone GrpE